MWARIELLVRRAVAGVLAALGTPGVSLALLALTVVAGAISYGWSAWGDPERAGRFATSPACWAVALALLADGAVATSRLRDRSRGADGGAHAVVSQYVFVRGAQVAWALALLASISGRAGFDVRVAEGEEFSGRPEQFVATDPPRWVSPGPFQARFTVDAVERSTKEQDRGVSLVALRTPDGATKSASRYGPIWFGWGRFLRPVRAGWALRYELATPTGRAVEGAVAKLELEPSGSVDSIRLSSLPYRVFVALAREQPPAGRGPALEVMVYRGKRSVAQGVLAPGAPLGFEGGLVRFPEARRWVTFRMTSDPGIPVACLAIALGAAGAVIAFIRRVRGSPARD
jgi:hypothetical protein